MNALKFIDQHGLLSTKHFNQVTFNNINDLVETKLAVDCIYVQIKKGRLSEIFKLPIATMFGRFEYGPQSLGATVFRQKNLIISAALRSDEDKKKSKILGFLGDNFGIIIATKSIAIFDETSKTITVTSEVEEVKPWDLIIGKSNKRDYKRIEKEIENLKFDVIAVSLNHKGTVTRTGLINEKKK